VPGFYHGGDLGEFGPSGRKQPFAVGGALGFQGRVVAGDQPFAGVVRVADLGQVLGVEQAGPKIRLELGARQRPAALPPGSG
jgi:hypothetical protein